MSTDNLAVRAHFMFADLNMSLFDISKKLGMHPKEVGVLLAKATVAKEEFLSIEPVVYRKYHSGKTAICKPRIFIDIEDTIDVDTLRQAVKTMGEAKGWTVK